MREPLRFESLLAFKETVGIAVQSLAEGFTGWQWLQAGTHPGYAGAALGSARWGPLEHPLGPGAQAVHRHKAGLGAHSGRRHTRQAGVLELAGDLPPGR